MNNIIERSENDPSETFMDSDIKMDVTDEISPGNHYKFCPRCANQGVFNIKCFSFSCAACGFQFYLNSAAAVIAVIFDQNNRLLMVRRGIEPSKGMLDLPGGFVDPGESAEYALRREIKEELNIVVDSYSYIGSFPNRYPFAGTEVFTVDLAYRCNINNYESMKFGDDISGIEFFDLNEIDIDQIPFHSIKKVITQLKNEYL
jgi:NAD+ diphosphatase